MDDNCSLPCHVLHPHANPSFSCTCKSTCIGKFGFTLRLVKHCSFFFGLLFVDMNQALVSLRGWLVGGLRIVVFMVLFSL